jgi:hypothetical protein
MSDVSQGPGWWQASDLKWYPPESQPNYAPPPPPPSQPPPPGYPIPTAGQAPGIPHGNIPQPRPAYPQNQAGGAQTASDSLAAAKVLLANLSLTSGLIYGGLIIAVIGILCPWVTVSVMGIEEGSRDFGPHISWKYAALLVIAAAGWLAWPTVSRSQLQLNRLIGLTAAVGVLGLVFIIGFYDIVSFSSNISEMTYKIADVDPGWGLWLYAAAVIASAAGVVQLWIHSRKTQA